MRHAALAIGLIALALATMAPTCTTPPPPGDPPDLGCGGNDGAVVWACPPEYMTTFCHWDCGGPP